MALLAGLIFGEDGIAVRGRTTYGNLNQIIPTRELQIDFNSVLFQKAPYTMATYERVVMLMTGGFAD